ncbi:MAG: alpha/beta fold hydrolase [Pleurocapsa sp.]
MLQRHTFQHEQIVISYLRYNNLPTQSDRSKQPLILLHGLADCAMVWSGLMEYLGTQYDIIAPDLRGHGESSKPENGYSSGEIIEDLEALLRHLGWNRVNLLGHSWGGKLATIWATHYPQRFSSLILVDPFFVDKLPSWFKITFPFLYRVLPFLRGMGPFSSLEAAEKLAKTLKQYRQWTPLQQQAFRATIEPKNNGTWGSKFTIAARNQIFTDVMMQSGLSKSLDIPTLFVQPTKGLNRTQWQLQPYYNYLKNLKITQVAGNHWIFLVNPNDFNQAVAEFLQLIPSQ